MFFEHHTKVFKQIARKNIHPLLLRKLKSVILKLIASIYLQNVSGHEGQVAKMTNCCMKTEGGFYVWRLKSHEIKPEMTNWPFAHSGSFWVNWLEKWVSLFFELKKADLIYYPNSCCSNKQNLPWRTKYLFCWHITLKWRYVFIRRQNKWIKLTCV